MPENLRDLSGDALRQAAIVYRKKEIVKLVCRQTNYTEDEAEKLLEKEKYNYMKVIKGYMNPTPKETQQKGKSLNQQIIGEIRNFMDQGVKLAEYRKKKAAHIRRMQQMQQKRKEVEESQKKAIEDGNKKL